MLEVFKHLGDFALSHRTFQGVKGFPQCLAVIDLGREVTAHLAVVLQNSSCVSNTTTEFGYVTNKRLAAARHSGGSRSTLARLLGDDSCPTDSTEPTIR
jgi:hypothetical protein